MPTTFGNIQTMALVYQQICEGEGPWVALGNFTNAWYGYAKDMRSALVSEPLALSATSTDYTHHWAAFCAASVEFLCERYGYRAQSGYTIHIMCYHIRGMAMRGKIYHHRYNRNWCEQHRHLSQTAISSVATAFSRTNMK